MLGDLNEGHSRNKHSYSRRDSYDYGNPHNTTANRSGSSRDFYL